jgi:nicotinamidase-related amidase
MHDIHMFDRKGALNLDDFEGGGADWLDEFKPSINDKKTVICSPHKAYGPENNDLILQLQKQRIEKVILAGMSANLCVESHMRELIERGFEVVIVPDATAAAKLPGLDGMAAALVNFTMIASAVWTTSMAIQKITDSAAKKAKAA